MRGLRRLRRFPSLTGFAGFISNRTTTAGASWLLQASQGFIRKFRIFRRLSRLQAIQGSHSYQSSSFCSEIVTQKENRKKKKKTFFAKAVQRILNSQNFTRCFFFLMTMHRRPCYARFGGNTLLRHGVGVCLLSTLYAAFSRCL